MLKVDQDKFVKICKDALTMCDAHRQMIPKMSYNTFLKYARKFDCYKTNQAGVGLTKRGFEKKTLEHIFANRVTIASNHLKNKLFKSGIKECMCEECKIKEWQNMPIVFELHHIDGNKNNNVLDNLQILCPNCHSQTPNFRNKKR